MACCSCRALLLLPSFLSVSSAELLLRLQGHESTSSHHPVPFSIASATGLGGSERKLLRAGSQRSLAIPGTQSERRPSMRGDAAAVAAGLAGLAAGGGIDSPRTGPPKLDRPASIRVRSPLRLSCVGELLLNFALVLSCGSRTPSTATV